MIAPFGDSFTDSTHVVRRLNKIIDNYWMGQFSSWTTAPKEVKELWWNEFKRKFRWDEAEEKEVKRIFKKKAGDHMRNVMNRAKKDKKSRILLQPTIGRKSKELGTPKSISKSVKLIRRIELLVLVKGLPHMLGVLLISGSIEKEWQMNWGRNQHLWLHLNAPFRKKIRHGPAIEQKLLSGDGDGDGDGAAASEPSVDSMALWMEASGGMRRGQIFGMGSLSRMYRTPAAATSSSSAAFLRAQHEERTDQELNRLKQLLVQKDEEMKQLLKSEEKRHKDVKVIEDHFRIRRRAFFKLEGEEIKRITKSSQLLSNGSSMDLRSGK
ncbi:uncharacterized protein LOC130137897 [Syzygium oleosum]|uniref:uncharacterized protein LOC130137897 n=1 Tax=Syzygium oleosum TaxID=219896 RepID=UPI0024BBC6EC|nr:uncharacterized protein LOC130137897 [Syzygium oleosum]